MLLKDNPIPNHEWYTQYLQEPHHFYNDVHSILAHHANTPEAQFYQDHVICSMRHQDYNLRIDGTHLIDTFDISPDNHNMDGYDVFWVVNDLWFYKNNVFQFALTALDVIEFFHYNTSRSDILYDALHDNEYIYVGNCIYLPNGLYSISYAGPWAPYSIYTYKDHSVYFSRNKLLKAVKL